MTAPASLFAELRERFGAARARPQLPAAGRPDRPRARCAAPPSRRSQPTLWLAERFDPELAVRRVHGRRPRPASRLARSGRSGAPRARSPAPTGSSTRRSARSSSTPAAATCSSSPTTARARSTASSTSTPGSRARGISTYTRPARALGRQLFDRAFELRRRLPQRFRYAVKQRAPDCASASTSARTYSAVDWAADARVRVRHVRQRRRQRPRPREPGHGRAGRGVRARARRDRREGDGAARARTASRSSPRCTGARSSSRARSSTRCPTCWSSSPTTRGSARATSRSARDTIWDTIEIEPGSEHVYVGSHRHEGVFALAGPVGRAAPRTLAEIAGRRADRPLPARRAGADAARGPDRRRGDRSGAPRRPPAGVRRPTSHLERASWLAVAATARARRTRSRRAAADEDGGGDPRRPRTRRLPRREPRLDPGARLARRVARAVRLSDRRDQPHTRRGG